MYQYGNPVTPSPTETVVLCIVHFAIQPRL